MTVDFGELRTRCGVRETNLVPRRRSSRMTGGRPDGRSAGRSGSCLPTTRPAALETDNTPGLVSGFGAAVRTGGVLGGASRGFFTSIHPEYNPNVVLSNSG